MRLLLAAIGTLWVASLTQLVVSADVQEAAVADGNGFIMRLKRQTRTCDTIYAAYLSGAKLTNQDYLDWTAWKCKTWFPAGIGAQPRSCDTIYAAKNAGTAMTAQDYADWTAWLCKTWFPLGIGATTTGTSTATATRTTTRVGSTTTAANTVTSTASRTITATPPTSTLTKAVTQTATTDVTTTKTATATLTKTTLAAAVTTTKFTTATPIRSSTTLSVTPLAGSGPVGTCSSGLLASGVSFDPAISAALVSGDASALSVSTILDATRSYISSQQSEYSSIKQAIFGLNADGTANANSLKGITWDPAQSSIFLTSLDLTRTLPILQANWAYKTNVASTGVGLAFVGTGSDCSRYAAFGFSPIGKPGNAAMDSVMLNTVKWLLKSTTIPTSLKIVTAHIPSSDSYWNYEAPTRTWFAKNFPGVTINGVSTNPATQADNACDGAALAGCLQGTVDLLVIGAQQGPNAYNGDVVQQAVISARARGTAVLYLHHDWVITDLAARMLALFQISSSNNWWDQNGLLDWDPSTLLPAGPIGPIMTLVNRLEKGDFTSKFTQCTLTGISRVVCSADTTYMAEFGTTAENLRAIIRNLDANNRYIFGSSSEYQLERLLILLGDKYREQITYPLSKLVNGATWYRAYFSDMVSYMHRQYSTVAKNLGNYAGVIPASVPTISSTVDVAVPSSGTTDYMTGLYVMPGRSMTLKRLDLSTAPLTIQINMFRDTTWVFNEPTGMDRPTLLASPISSLSNGQELVITSPYGGMLFFHVGAATSGPQTVSVRVDGVTTHPVIRNANDPAQLAAFDAQLKSTATNWVGIVTDALVLHSKLDMFQQSQKTYSGNLTKLVMYTWTYMIKDTYELAGFNSAAGTFALSKEAVAFCNANGWDCNGVQHRKDGTQHVIADSHAYCGSGCAGNPYDQDWAFDPLGWGETHEIGHGIQPDLLRVYSGMSGEVSNNVFPVHKHYIWNSGPDGLIKQIIDRQGAGLKVFNILKSAAASSNASASTYTAVWSDPAYAANNDERVMFYRQLVEYNRYYNKNMGDGWPIISLLYLNLRNFQAASKLWSPSIAASFGFSTFTTYPATLTGNDYLVIGK
ncbi:hypothetical protein HDU93_005001 [Gonapodya sp. JEL0774]|nr:hypothetical protein HDU93_005001 [Gonapodya sp. JEL0774]